jgi:hypothetical protein
MGYENRPNLAVILSLIGGILMILSGAIFSMFGFTGFGMMGGYRGMMGGYWGMMGSFGFPFGFMMFFSLIGVVSGVLVIIGAVMLNTHSSEHTTWGIIVLVFSMISFLGSGGFFVGAILGIIGGVFALSWRPTINR